MTREEQRCKAAKEYAEKWYKKLGTSVEEYPTDAQITIDEFIKGAEWADNHPNWHKADEELPPINTTITYKFSKKVLVSDGEQLADDRKTLNGDIMSDADTLDEIKALSKRSANFIKKHYLSESKTTVKPRNSAKVKTQGLHKRMGYDR